MTTTHDDLQRSIGRIEGNLGALGSRMDRSDQTNTQGFTKIEDALKAIDTRLEKLEAKENERKGATAMIVSFASLLSGLVGAFLTRWFS